MVMVRAQADHTNEYGDSVIKIVGDSYEISDADIAFLLASQGIIEIITDTRPAKANKVETD